MARSKEEYFNSMMEFVRMGPSRGVNNYTLSGPINEPTRFHTFGAFFPLSPSERDWVVLGFGGERFKQRDVYRKIMSLTIPERIQGLPIQDNLQARVVREALHALQGLPNVGLSFGRTVSDVRETIVMFAIPEIKPITALEMLKKEAQERMSSYN